jgi:hypothetical protein
VALYALISKIVDRMVEYSFSVLALKMKYFVVNFALKNLKRKGRKADLLLSIHPLCREGRKDIIRAKSICNAANLSFMPCKGIYH